MATPILSTPRGYDLILRAKYNLRAMACRIASPPLRLRSAIVGPAMGLLLVLVLAAEGWIARPAALAASDAQVTSQVIVHPRAVSVVINGSVRFRASVTRTADQRVRWSVDGVPGGNSNVGMISVNGTYSAPPTPGAHQIAATSRLRPRAQGSATAFAVDYPGTFTYHNDNARTGQNLQEIALSPQNVNADSFGKLFQFPVDGFVYAQPLYGAGVNVPGKGQHNLVYVATEHDSVYALDADAFMPALWHVSFINPAKGITPVPFTDVLTNDIVPEIGITGTPAIDRNSGTLYVVVKTKEKGNYVQRLHALDITSGVEKFGGPAAINASAAGSGAPNDGNGHVLFDPLRQNQRSALLLAGGVVYVAFASHGDNGPYHGWLLAYDAASLAQLGAYNDTPNGIEGGIWQSGCGPAADSSQNIFLDTGNGTFNANLDTFGDSALKLKLMSNAPAPGFTLSLLDSFTPFNEADLANTDADYGSGGALILPDQSTSPAHLLVSGDKSGNIYLLNRDQMGHFQSGSNSQIVQYLPGALGPVFSVPAYWQGNVYFAGVRDSLKAFQLSNNQLSTSPTSQSETSFGFPGATPAVSANGASGGIVWVLDNSGFSSGPAVLHAYDATDLSNELYNSARMPGRDRGGKAVKFTVPTVAAGRVYVGGQKILSVYGLLP
jgi:hypothetical protein